MAVLKCKMCGGDLVIEEEKTVCECEYCGSRQTIPVVDDEKKMTLYERANRLRFNSEFDKAAGVYEQIIGEFHEEAEAYWGILLCRYGIEYVDDPGTGKKVATCHRSSFDSFMDDEDFEMVMENSDASSRSVYREQAKEIEEIRKGIIEVSGREDPYDIFICYKETDENGERTIDSVIAQDVYDALTGKGYRVFFSRISLEDKLGVEYEPYIFAALNSAKVMLAFGTSYDNYNAVWVKNEWSRFLKLMAIDKTKHLIPCYKNLDAYDIPKEFVKLQAQDMGKVGAVQDLVRGIDKLIGKNDAVKNESLVQHSRNVLVSNIEPLLRRAFMFLEDSNWKEANIYCEKVLDQDPENVQAYLGKLMAEQKVCKQEELADCEKPFDNSNNYKKVIRFGDDTISATLKGYIDQINERIENKRLVDVYNESTSIMKSADLQIEYEDRAEGFMNAAKGFKTISGYRDADVLAEQCLEKAENARRQEEEKVAKEKEKIDCIVAALKEGSKAKKGPTLEEMLARSKKRVDDLSPLLDGIDDLLAEASRLRQEVDTIATELSDISNRISALDFQEENLNIRRSKLGIFSGKEKKQIDEELAEIASENRDINERKSVLDAKKRKLNEELGRIDRKCCGFYSKEDIEKELEQETAKISKIEMQIENKRVNGGNKYSYEEAFRLYLSDSVVTRGVNLLLYPNKGVDSIVFGKYIQKPESLPEPIEWLILERESDRILVISKYALDYQPFHNDILASDITWGDCYLRRWLNDTFLNSAFSVEEQKKILFSNVKADKNPKSRYSPGRDTTDKIFLLSINEIYKYNKAEYEEAEYKERHLLSCTGTKYCYSKGAFKHTSFGTTKTEWWLRSPGIESGSHVSRVEFVGRVDLDGTKMTLSMAVRPAMWISLESDTEGNRSNSIINRENDEERIIRSIIPSTVFIAGAEALKDNIDELENISLDKITEVLEKLVKEGVLAEEDGCYTVL